MNQTGSTPGCDPGAPPPFGALYGVDVFLDRSLVDVGAIVIPSGDHSEDIHMTVGNYLRVARPAIAELAVASLAA